MKHYQKPRWEVIRPEAEDPDLITGSPDYEHGLSSEDGDGSTWSLGE